MKRVAIALATLTLTGCTSLSKMNDWERHEQVTGVDRHSSYPALRRESFEWINLIEMIDPAGKAEDQFKIAWGRTSKKGAGKESDEPLRTGEGNASFSYGVRYDLVLSWFRMTPDYDDTQKRRLRNGAQEKMLAVSQSRCNVFKTYLRRDQADTNFLFGALTTASGVLGAMLQGATASRNLAGAAGLFSGIRSEYNQTYYSNLAAHVIVKGIEARQEEVYRRIQLEGQDQSIDKYPLDAAIKDAIYFDGLCSVVAGLDKAAASVDAAAEPGMDAAMRTVLRAKLLKEAADMSPAELLKPETLDKISSAGSRLGLSLVGSARGHAGAQDSELDLYAATNKMVAQLALAAKESGLRIETAALDKKKALLTSKEADTPDVLAVYPPKDGELSSQAASALGNGIVKALGIDVNSCFTAIALPAIEARSQAATQRQVASQASDPEEKKAKESQAEFALKKAHRAIEQAHDDLAKIAAAVRLDFSAFEAKRLHEASKLEIATVKANKSWSQHIAVAQAKPAASEGLGCKAKVP